MNASRGIASSTKDLQVFQRAGYGKWRSQNIEASNTMTNEIFAVFLITCAHNESI